MEHLDELVEVMKEGFRQIAEVARQLEEIKMEVRGVKEELKRRTVDTRTARETTEEGEDAVARGESAGNLEENEREKKESRREENRKEKKENGNRPTKRGENGEEEGGRREGEKRWEKVQGKGIRDEEKDRKRKRWEEELIERGKRKNNVLLRGKMDVEKMGIGRTEEIVGMVLGKEVRIRRIVERMKRGEEGTMVLEMEDEDGKADMLEGRKKMEEEGLEVKEDLTWWERKTRYKLSERAIEERAKGKKVWMDSRSIKINGTLWRWDELEEKWQAG